MDHAAMLKAEAATAQAAAPPSQAAFATISDIVKKLKADAATDWSKVNLEALRQHLIDMDDAVMRSSVKQSNVPGGVSLDVTGAGRATGAIRRMLTSHAAALSDEPNYAAAARDIPGGTRFVVTAKNPGDASVVAQIRALGFAGLITEADHHAAHHLAVAKGDAAMGHTHKP